MTEVTMHDRTHFSMQYFCFNFPFLLTLLSHVNSSAAFFNISKYKMSGRSAKPGHLQWQNLEPLSEEPLWEIGQVCPNL